MAFAKLVPIALLFVFLGDAQAISRTIGSNEACVGPALVKPEGGLFGALYITDASGQFGRSGYLPSNTVVIVDDPPNDYRGRRQYCHFNYRNIVSGYLARKYLISLPGIAQSVGLDITKIEGFIGPANPAQDKRLRLYRTEQLSTRDEFKDLGRNDSAIIFLLESNRTVGKEALKVGFVANADHPVLTLAYVRASEDRSILNDEGESNFDGTFRVYRPQLTRPYPSTVPPPRSGSPYDYLKHIVRETETKIKATLAGTKDALKSIAGLKDCRKRETIKVGLSLKAGADASVLSVAAAGEGSIEWIKPEGEVEQFARIGQRDDFNLTVHGIASCSKDATAYLSQAHVVITGERGIDKGQFLLDSAEFFEKVTNDDGGKNNPIPANLVKLASSVNLNRNRTLATLFIVPRKNGDTPFYYTLFDRIEGYVDEQVFDDGQNKLSDDDKFALVLVIAQFFGHWR